MEKPRRVGVGQGFQLAPTGAVARNVAGSGRRRTRFAGEQPPESLLGPHWGAPAEAGVIGVEWASWCEQWVLRRRNLAGYSASD